MGETASLFYSLGIAIATFSVLFPICIGLFKFRSLDIPLRIFFWYQVICFATSMIGSWQARHGINNGLTYIIFTIIQSLLFLSYFKVSFKRQSAITRVIYFSIAISLVSGYWTIYTFLSKKGIEAYPYWPPLAFNLPLIALSLYMYYRFMVDLNIPKLTISPTFWTNTSIFLYFSTTMISFVFDGLMRTGSMEFGLPLVWVNIVAGTTAYVLSGIAFLKHPKKPLPSN